MTTQFRERCYECFRPAANCFCGLIPSIANHTDILILQHARERFHPFNTARILRKALAKSSLIVGYTPEFAAADLPFDVNAGLLYPSDDAISLSSLCDTERPNQLVVIDGTWHHAKTMFRDVPAIRNLPRYKITPDSPGQYRIRREPNAESLSTLEATVAALQELEPIVDLAPLLKAFNSMVTSQLDHPNLKQAWRRKEKHCRPSLAIPRTIANSLENIVVAYGESAPGQRGVKRKSSPPIFWVAKRLQSNDSFRQTIRSETNGSEDLPDNVLRHLRLDRAEFDSAVTADEFRSRWKSFLRPNDRLAVFQKSSMRLLKHVDADFVSTTVLKSIRVPNMANYRTLDDLIEGERLAVSPPKSADRATERLENAVAYVLHLHRITLAAML